MAGELQTRLRRARSHDWQGQNFKAVAYDFFTDYTAHMLRAFLSTAVLRALGTFAEVIEVTWQCGVPYVYVYLKLIDLIHRLLIVANHQNSKKAPSFGKHV